ncbi:two-component system response regulator receiver protein [Enterococcus sp. 8G7_MSG3316]|uniref:Two-component system response regulator receiver protein n=1 Tax=Candidatus Enterococcus testudinis TaxID=1834191 RepID=A0A242A9G7_9ENTE|nr:response regulator transcription factor [Enterococcus sp. 8G7_MSG3316]OTN77674.1 two-component system response regulator receiver protein [Enterococcus sp. 8G7_MSG3316]
MIKILLVEDDKTLSENIKEIVGEIGDVTQSYDGSEGLYEAETGIYDLIILDLMMPEMDGYEVLAALRSKGIQTPVLILTAKDGLEDKVTGFQKGADDYLTKPFYREELLMRVKALLKRSLGLFNENNIEYKGLVCKLAANEVTFNGQLLPIQGKEFELLLYFLQNKGIILTKEQIFDRIWGFDSETTLTVVEVYMSNLRKHLRDTGVDKEIRTLRNVGYIMQGA